MVERGSSDVCQLANGPVTTYASRLRDELEASVAELTAKHPTGDGGSGDPVTEQTTDDAGPDIFELARQQAFASLKVDQDFWRQFNGDGIPWFVVIRKLEQYLPPTLHNRNEVAANLVVEAMKHVVGTQKQAWDAELRDTQGGKRIRKIFKI